MFVYLILIVAAISAVLSWVGISVTDDVVIPVPKDELNQINAHLGGAWSIYDSTTGEPPEAPEFVISNEGPIGRQVGHEAEDPSRLAHVP